MTRWEKYALASLLQAVRPDVAIEIGTYQGGSLQLLSQYAQKVYSVDISPEPASRLGDSFPNVDFLIGSSKEVLPGLIRAISESRERLGFILVDGDHSHAGVMSDANAILKYVPVGPLFIVFHDSFNPECRKGILSSNWRACDHVHLVEIDFVPGVYYQQACGRAAERSMWGGLALALSLPEKRTKPLEIHQSQWLLFHAALRHSGYRRRALFNAIRATLGGIKRKIVGKRHAEKPSGTPQVFR